MDLNKYANDGWGISVDGFTYLFNLIQNFEKNDLRVLEFGSGHSTMFFVDIVKNKIKNLDITSFDDNIDHSYQNPEDDSFVRVNIRRLVECDDHSYNIQFSESTYIKELMYEKQSPLIATQKNNFYNLYDNDLHGYYDIVLLDGPHGNGRNFAFLHLIGHVKSGTIIFIDDYNHYDFLGKCLEFFECDILVKKYQIGDCFAIVRVK